MQPHQTVHQTTKEEIESTRKKTKPPGDKTSTLSLKSF